MSFWKTDFKFKKRSTRFYFSIFISNACETAKWKMTTEYLKASLPLSAVSNDIFQVTESFNGDTVFPTGPYLNGFSSDQEAHNVFI